MFNTGIIAAIRRHTRALGRPPSEAERGFTGNQRLQSLFFELCQRLQPQIFLDVGANDGAASLAVVDRLPGCEIHAFEANPDIYARSAPKLRLAGIQTWNLAVSDTAGPTTIYAPVTLSRCYVDGKIISARVQETSDTGRTSLLLRDEDATYNEFPVEAITLDGFALGNLGAGQGRRILLWIDVEGATDRVLAGAAHVLAQSLAAFVEVEGFRFWKNQADRGAVVAAFARHDFVPLARDREYGDFQHNVIFVHRTVLDRLLPLCFDGSADLHFAPFFNAALTSRDR